MTVKDLAEILLTQGWRAREINQDSREYIPPSPRNFSFICSSDQGFKVNGEKLRVENCSYSYLSGDLTEYVDHGTWKSLRIFKIRD